MIVLDTTVLVYAVGADYPLRGPCQQLIRAIAGGTILATTTIEVIQEFTHVRARRRDRKDAAELARDYIELLSPLLIVEETDLREGLRLFEVGTGFGSFAAWAAAARTASNEPKPVPSSNRRSPSRRSVSSTIRSGDSNSM